MGSEGEIDPLGAVGRPSDACGVSIRMIDLDQTPVTPLDQDWVGIRGKPQGARRWSLGVGEEQLIKERVGARRGLPAADIGVAERLIHVGGTGIVRIGEPQQERVEMRLKGGCQSPSR